MVSPNKRDAVDAGRSSAFALLHPRPVATHRGRSIAATSAGASSGGAPCL
jgi:hypothetical protein